MTGEPRSDVADALAPICRVLLSDGFDGRWQETDDGVVFRVGLGTADCEDCLVPRAVLETMVSVALRPTGRRLARLDMPGE